MHVPDVPDPASPSPPALQRVIRCLPADIAATQKARDRSQTGVGSADRRYLDRLIGKPWGSEFRVYEDDLAEIWCLHIRPEQRTSLHCHRHKVAAMLCLEGKGTLSTCSGVQYALAPGVVLQIESGAYHRSAAASTGLTLIEVETPKDKFDLLRIEDDYRAVTDPYEDERHAPLQPVKRAVAAPAAVPLALQPFVERALGVRRWARLRAPSATGRHRFAVQTGEQVRTAVNLIFAIALEPRDQPPREVTVLGAEAVFAAAPQTVYLTIQSR
jgi:mannose-6-phosphate isomerase-like protein (cupin superfamily)